MFGHGFAPRDVRALARDLEGDGVGFSDSPGQQFVDGAFTACGGKGGMPAEILWCLGAEVAFALAERGGRDLISA